MKSHLAIAGAVLLIAGQPALADYGATRWGMSAEDVIAATGGDARKVKDNKDKRILDHRLFAMSTFEDGGITYEVSYFFGKDGKGLTMVNLVPADPENNCADTRIAFLGRLGAGIESKSPPVVEGLEQTGIAWRSGVGDEMVEYAEVRLFGKAAHCQVLYQQRQSTEN
jgi:hypothetical protein